MSMQVTDGLVQCSTRSCEALRLKERARSVCVCPVEPQQKTLPNVGCSVYADFIQWGRIECL